MKKISLLMVFFIAAVGAIAQTRTVSGVVKDKDGRPVEGASIVVKGSSAGTAAGADGSFKTSVKAGDVLVISSVNFEPFEITVGDQPVLNISLKRADALINEVVVTALGVRRNKNTLPYAAQQVTGDDISKSRSGNAASALSGKVSGLEIRQGNGIGGSTNIVIRGTKSLLGNNQALFVVDGVPVNGSIRDFSPDDVESITVLKDASAASTLL